MSNSHILVKGLLALLEPRLNIRYVSSYDSARPPEHELENPPRHVVLLDSNLGLDVNIAWINYWRDCTPRATVVILELSNNRDHILSCIEAGATAYTLAGATIDDISKTIKLAANGEAVCSPEMTVQVFERLVNLKYMVDNNEKSINPLTPRETEVLTFVSRGHTNDEIAQRLVISTRTVKHHIHNILNKLDLKRRYQAANLAQEEGWIP